MILYPQDLQGSFTVLMIFFIIGGFLNVITLGNECKKTNDESNYLKKQNDYMVSMFSNNESNYVKKQNDYIVSMFANNEIIFNDVNEDELKKPIKIHQAFYDPLTIYPEFKNINYDIIKQELNDYNKNINDWQDWPEYNLWNKEGEWKIIPIYSFNSLTNKSKYFPNTINMLNNINGIVNIGFSKFKPNTKLTLHKGWGKLSNNVLRCHLGIDVPEKCYLYVMDPYGNHRIQQENKKWIVFDDSLYHSAENKSNKDRIVLIIDIKRPDYLHKGISDIEDTEELQAFIESSKDKI